MRLWLACSSILLVAALARPGAAQTRLNGGVIKFSLFIPKDNGADGKAQSVRADDYQAVTTPAMSPDMRRYFNAARCSCDRQDPATMAPTRQHFLLRLAYATMPMTDPGDVPLEVFAGDDCANPATDPATLITRCSKLSALSANALDDGAEDLFVRAGELLASGSTNAVPNPCSPAIVDSDVIAVSGSPTRFIESGAAFNIPFDLQAPPMPLKVKPIGLDRAIRITWDTPSDAPEYYQALCVKEDGSPAHSVASDVNQPEPTHEAQYDSTQSVCGVAPVAPMAAELDDGTMATGTLPAVLGKLDERYLCGQSSGSTSSIDLAGLENQVAYWIVVLAIDAAGNYEARYVPRPVTPLPDIDFWEDANGENPEISGGFCVAQVGRDGQLGGALLVLGAVLLSGRRRRRRQAVRAATAAGALALALVAIAPSAARAQDYDPYWNDVGSDSTLREEVPEWHVGLRLGPYYPTIDDSFTSEPGPYRRMFGPGYNLVPQLDLHRVWPVGPVQLGVGMSVGYYSKSAEVFDQMTGARRPDAINTFKMIPLSLSGVARLTALDDRWGFPLVPYVRGGAAYHVWWVRTPAGSLAVTCDTCGDKALGASAGLVGAVGIAIRGERLDPTAASSMRTGGVEHAGFYAELETSWVDGFGNARRLSLGDTTWSAGVDFEF